MSEVILGYAPVDGRLVAGRHRDTRGRWVQPLYTGDDLMMAAATELDKAVLGADTEQVMVVWRTDGGEERYRTAICLSFRGLAPEDAHREAELLQAAAHSRCDPPGNDPFDARTLATKPAA